MKISPSIASSNLLNILGGVIYSKDTILAVIVSSSFEK